MDFCSAHQPLRPACKTHQLIGMYLMKERACGDALATNNVIDHLQNDIESQLHWDVRLVDVYMQRVLMLTLTGKAGQLKPVWIQRILDAQLEDGGWTGFQPVIPLWSDYALGFTVKYPGVKKIETNFHATIQGVFLMALLKHGVVSPK